MTLRGTAVLVVLAALASPGRPEDAPAPGEVEQALQLLAQDERKGLEEALDVLVRDGGRKSVEAVLDFGAQTFFHESAVLAGRALARLGDEAAGMLDRRLKVHGKNPSALAHLAMMAEQIQGAKATEVLERLSADPRPEVSSIAVRALGARGDPSGRKKLSALLRSPRPEVAKAAAFALGNLPPDEETMELLFKRAQTSIEDRVCDACALALSRMEGAGAYAERALDLAMGRTNHDSFHGLVKLALRSTKEPDPELLQKALKSGSRQIREIACDLIGLYRVQGFQEQLLRMAGSEGHWRNAVAAWLALRRAGIDQVLDGVAKAILGEGETSYWAIQCAINHPHPELAGALRSAALDSKDPVRRELAQRALRRAEKERDATRAYYLQAAREQRGTPAGRAALLALGNLKDVPSFQALVDLLEKEKEPSWQLSIVKGLEKLTGHYYRPDPAIWREWFEVVEGQVAWDPKPIDRASNRERVKDVQKLGISPKTEAAVERGLAWLRRHQGVDGGWNGATYGERCSPSGSCSAEGGIRDRPLAYTGLALLAYLGAGYSHLEGPYRDVVQRGFEYILANQDYDGSHLEESWTFSYEAAIVCQALCDGYALTGDPWLGHGAQRMIDYLVKIQYPGRTWRYRVRSTETDTSVMSWILTACIAARHAGIDIPEQIFVASEVWLDTASDPVPAGEFEIFVRDQFDEKNPYFIDVSRDDRGKPRTFTIKTWYQPPRLYTPAMSAIGMLVRIWLGWTRAHPFSIGSANQVMTQIPGYGTGLEGEFAFYPYTWYYGSLAMYQMGGRYWTQWRERCIDDLIRHQEVVGCDDGSWKMPRGQFVSGLTGGTVYCTAMAILTLETFYRYQPYLARHDLRSREEEPAKDSKESKDAQAAK